LADESKPVEFSTEQLQKFFKLSNGGGGISISPLWLVVLIALGGGNMLYNPNSSQLEEISSELRRTSDGVREIKGGLEAVGVDVEILQKRLDRIDDEMLKLQTRVENATLDARLAKRLADAKASGNGPGERSPE